MQFEIQTCKFVCVVFLVDKLGVAAGLERHRFPWVGPSVDAQH